MKLYWVFSTFGIGGPQRRMATLIDALGTDYTHAITAMDGQYAAEALLPETIKWSRHEVPVRKTSLVSPGNVSAFRKALREVAPDLLLTSNWGTIEWHLANSGPGARPHVHFEDGFGPDETGGNFNRKRDLARGFVFSGLLSARSKREFVCPSTVLEQRFTRDWAVPAGKVDLIPNGIELDPFTAITPPFEAGTVIGSVGALRREKRFDRLIDAFAAFLQKHEGRLLIVGDGPERPALEAQATALGLGNHVEFTGATTDVAGALSRMTLFALTSDTEQMPISLVEAMAAGLPVVATDVGDVRMILAEENRTFVHPVTDIARLTASLGAIASDPGYGRKLGAANREKAIADYPLDRMIASYRQLFTRLTGTA